MGSIDHYFNLFYDSKDGVFLGARKKDVIEAEWALCGYFVIVSSEKMTAKEAIFLYNDTEAR